MLGWCGRVVVVVGKGEEECVDGVWVVDVKEVMVGEKGIE